MSGRALVEKLPYDAEIEYLESSGTQWIDTGIPTNLIAAFYVRIAPLVPLNSTVRYCIGADNTGNNRFSLAFYSGSIEIRLGYYYYPGTYGGLNVWKDITMNALLGTAKINNDSYNFVKVENRTSHTFTLFCMWAAGGYLVSSSITQPVRISNFIAYSDENENNVLMSLIPVRVGNVGYMYDKISGQLFGNSGTGDFILGTDKTN